MGRSLLVIKEEGGGGGGGARRRVPDIAGEVGSGDDDLEGLKRDPIFDTQESQARARPQSVVQPGESAIFQTESSASEGGKTRAHEGDGGGKRTRRDGGSVSPSSLHRPGHQASLLGM